MKGQIIICFAFKYILNILLFIYLFILVWHTALQYKHQFTEVFFLVDKKLSIIILVAIIVLYISLSNFQPQSSKHYANINLLSYAVLCEN